MSRAARMGQNEVWFRDLNDRLESKALTRNGTNEPFDIVCECDREECTTRISVGVDEYEAVRATATDFIVAPGHADLSVERVVSRGETYDIVTKIGEAAAVAEAENPRG